jgi:hypothetical protein
MKKLKVNESPTEKGIWFLDGTDLPNTTLKFRSREEAEKAKRWFENPTPPEEGRPTLDEVMWQYDGHTTYVPNPCPSKWTGSILVFTDPFGSKAEEVIDYLWSGIYKEAARFKKYIVFLAEQRAEEVSEELKKWLIDASPWGFGWNRKLLEKTGADMTLWAKSEAEALKRSNNRWRRFDLDELNEILASIKSRYEVVKDFVELELHLLESILHELEETIHQLKEENKLDREMIKEVSRDELPF